MRRVLLLGASFAVLGACRAEPPPSERVGASAAAVVSDEHLLWTRAAENAPAPAARSAHAMAFDVPRSTTVLFGGQGGAAAFGDTWLWNGSVWTQVCVNASCAHPPARFAHAMAHDGARGVTVLFGGQGASLLGDTWEWNGSSWTQACTEAGCSAPSPRHGHAMVFDAARGVILLFGGQSCTGACAVLGDTWAWDGKTWTRLDAAGPARVGTAMTFDESRGEAVLFGGSNGMLLRDAWAWDGTRWALRVSGSFDTPSSRSDATLAYDETRASAMLFGGSNENADAWLWKGTAWESLPADASPLARMAHGMVYDRARMRFVVFGGFIGGSYLGDTWEAHRYGGACASAAECATGQCVDGVCCTSACGACEECNAAPSRGTCSAVTSREDLDTCKGERACNADGKCGSKNGVACRVRADCVSTWCVDGVCCDSACDGACRACRHDLTGAASGTCADVPAGTDPHRGCPDEGACSCQRDGFCDGHGSCRVYGPEQDCSKCGDAMGTALKSQCDGRGACVPKLPVACIDDQQLVASSGAITDCSPYKCSSGVCRQTCTSSSQCADGYECTADARCAAPPAPEVIAQACSMHPSRPREGATAWLVLLALLLRRRATNSLSA